MGYKKKTSLTLDLFNDMCEILFKNQNQKTYQQIKVKVTDFLTNFGDKKFLDVYNETQLTKNYKKALDTFKI